MKKMMVACLVFVLILITSISAFAAYLGDINNDGSVSAADARIILRHSAKIESIADEKLSIADVDKNGNVNAADARLALRMSAKLDELIEDHVHDYKTTEIQKLDCKTDGIIEYKCSVCGHSYQEVKKAEGHKYSSVVTKHSSCGAKGEKTFTCSICNHSYTEEIPALEHEYFSVVLREPSCATGLKEFECSICGDTYTEESPSILPNHRFTQLEVIKAATCAEAGIKEYTCEVCGEKKQEEIEKLAKHNYDYEGVLTKQPTYEEAGEKLITCRDCGDSYSEIVRALKYTYPVYIHMPETPIIVDSYADLFRIDEITFDSKYWKTTDDYSLYLYFTGEKTYGRKNDYIKIEYKLYDAEGFVVKTSSFVSDDLAPGEKIKNVQSVASSDLKAGEYTLVITNVLLK